MARPKHLSVSQPQTAKQWSKKYPRCRNCLLTDRPHWAKGLCSRCYFRFTRSIFGSLYRDYRVPAMSREHIGYLAGLVDGEGCLRSYRLKSASDGYKRQTLWFLTIANTDKDLISWVKDQLKCGNVYCSVSTGKRARHKPLYTFRVASRCQIKEILQLLVPYLKVKQLTAIQALHWIAANPYRGYSAWPKGGNSNATT